MGQNKKFEHYPQPLKKLIGLINDNGFFSPYEQASDFFYQAGSIGAAPVLLSLSGANLLLKAAAKLLTTIANLIDFNFEKAKKDFSKSSSFFAAGIISIGIALISPLINLIGFIGRSINTIASPSTHVRNSPVNNVTV